MLPPTVSAARAAAHFPWVRLAAVSAVLCSLAACASHYSSNAYQHGRSYARSTRYYPPPGPPNDPWGPYIREASVRFKVPERWVREVMRQESDGQEQAVSSAGAMGLMQVMPGTYDELSRRYALGGDPYEPHDNIMAGTAYLREMYDRYGAPGFLAAYNAGPYRLEDYLGGNGTLPDETVNYVASIAPRIAGTARMTGPLAVYAQSGPMLPVDATPVLEVAAPARALQGGGRACDPDAAYDPDRPCIPAPAPPATQVATATSSGCDPDAAFDPSRVCLPQTAAPLPSLPGGVRSLTSLYQPTPVAAPASSPAATTARAMPRSASNGGEWAIQVGAFKSSIQAREAAAGVHDALPDLLSAAQIELLPTAPFGGQILFRARLSKISANTASAACARLATGQQPCMVVSPGQSL